MKSNIDCPEFSLLYNPTIHMPSPFWIYFTNAPFNTKCTQRRLSQSYLLLLFNSFHVQMHRSWYGMNHWAHPTGCRIFPLCLSLMGFIASWKEIIPLIYVLEWFLPSIPLYKRSDCIFTLEHFVACFNIKMLGN